MGAAGVGTVVKRKSVGQNDLCSALQELRYRGKLFLVEFSERNAFVNEFVTCHCRRFGPRLLEVCSEGFSTSPCTLRFLRIR